MGSNLESRWGTQKAWGYTSQRECSLESRQDKTLGRRWMGSRWGSRRELEYTSRKGCSLEFRLGNQLELGYKSPKGYNLVSPNASKLGRHWKSSNSRLGNLWDSLKNLVCKFPLSWSSKSLRSMSDSRWGS